MTLPPKPWTAHTDYASASADGQSTTTVKDASGNIVMLVPSRAVADYVLLCCNAGDMHDTTTYKIP